MASWGKSTKGGSIHLDDLPSRVQDDFEGYLADLSNETERTKVVDEKTAREFIEKTLSNDLRLQAFAMGMTEGDRKRLFESNYIQNLIKENQKFVKGEADRIEQRRGARGRRMDEKRTAKDTRPVLPKNVRVWAKRPGKMDLQGIDTKKKGYQRRFLTPRRTSRYIRLVQSRGTHQWYQFRDIRTGKFMPNPDKRARK
jgi:hypothetical protein